MNIACVGWPQGLPCAISRSVQSRSLIGLCLREGGHVALLPAASSTWMSCPSFPLPACRPRWASFHNHRPCTWRPRCLVWLLLRGLEIPQHFLEGDSCSEGRLLQVHEGDVAVVPVNRIRLTAST